MRHSAGMVLTLEADAGHPGLAPSPIPLIRSAAIAHADREVADGRLVRVRRGVRPPHVVGLRSVGEVPARVHATAMTHPDAVFCLESAAALLGAPIFGHPRDVHVLDLPNANARLSGGLRHHTTAQDRNIVRIGGLLVTSLIDTTVDIARSRHPAVALSVADATLRLDRRHPSKSSSPRTRAVSASAVGGSHAGRCTAHRHQLRRRWSRSAAASSNGSVSTSRSCNGNSARATSSTARTCGGSMRVSSARQTAS